MASEERFRSPARKLIRFFRGSQQKWKQKCREAKYELKIARKKIRQLETSRAMWIKRARGAHEQAEQVKKKKRK